ncbi:MAG TPA: GntR family transcriptional regulator [Fibrobacteria bacterium]|nr:GntR family transcriptional regulator [Fibrobacteria bacterium]
MQKSLAHVREEIKSAVWSQGDRLPPIRVLARQAQVSAAAMCSALGMLKTEGLISIIKNRGAYLGLPPADGRNGYHTASPGESQRWQRLKIQIEKDIFNGFFTPGEAMPSLRDLQKSYAVSYKTLRKAMEAIASEGVVVPHKKTYLVPHLRRAHGTLVFISAPEAASKIICGGYPVTEFLSTLRREGGKSLINVVVIPYDPERRKAVFGNQLIALQEKHSVLGYILWTSMLPERKLDQALQTLREVQRPEAKPGSLDKPVAVVDTTWDMAITNALHHQADLAGWAFRIFTVAGLLAGRQVGQYLLKLGHRKVAFLSYCHKELWSQYRFRGLLQAFQGAGFGEGVRKFAIEEVDDRFHALPGPEELESFRKQADAFLAASMEAGQGYYASYAQEQMTGSIWNYIHQVKMAARVEPVLTAALQEPGLTACVGANDRMALLARDHLIKKGVRIPRDMSVIGFDDSKAATDNDLSSYSFAFSEIARKLLGHVLSPRQKAHSQEGNAVECEGLLIERGSSGHVRS